jgi:hypothetical protein
MPVLFNNAIWIQFVLSIVPALGLDMLCAYVVMLKTKAIIPDKVNVRLFA